ncbi:MAG: hypothetical protein C4291_03520 [Candidatus Dadabacteria bacterium]
MAKGIKLYAQVNQNAQEALFINGLTYYESGLNPMLTMDGTHGSVMGIDLVNAQIADPINVPAMVNVTHGKFTRVYIRHTGLPGDIPSPT